jgi:hypothetical protein
MVSLAGGFCHEALPLYTPWSYGTISSAGSKTFTAYVANNTADLTDAEIWLEVEVMGTANSALTTMTTDWRNSDGAGNDGTITTTPAAQTDDTISSWTGATLTYMQSLAVTATVGEEGVYRARIALAKPSSTVYIDPKITVS